MWPWEHLAFGYLVYTLGRRAVGAGSPTPKAALVLAFATQLPDLVDKPLAWGFELLPNGLSLAHSALVAVPVSAVAVLVTWRRDSRWLGFAFAVGYLSHLAGDVLYPLALGGDLTVGFLLWPLVERPPETAGFFTRIDSLWSLFTRFLATPRGRLYLAGEVAALGFVVVLWIRDGAPGLRWPELRGGWAAHYRRSK